MYQLIPFSYYSLCHILCGVINSLVLYNRYGPYIVLTIAARILELSYIIFLYLTNIIILYSLSIIQEKGRKDKRKRKKLYKKEERCSNPQREREN